MGKGVEYAYQVRYWKKLPKPKKKETPPPELPVNPDEVFILVLYYCMFPTAYTRLTLVCLIQLVF